jgi:hypothetical protein
VSSAVDSVTIPRNDTLPGEYPWLLSAESQQRYFVQHELTGNWAHDISQHTLPLAYQGSIGDRGMIHEVQANSASCSQGPCSRFVEGPTSTLRTETLGYSRTNFHVSVSPLNGEKDLYSRLCDVDCTHLTGRLPTRNEPFEVANRYAKYIEGCLNNADYFELVKCQE